LPTLPIISISQKKRYRKHCLACKTFAILLMAAG